MAISLTDLFTGIATVVAFAAYLSSLRNARELDRQKYYSDLDSLYLKVLKLGVTHPNLIDPAKTAAYEQKFTGDDLYRYNAYAYIAWNVCETIYDTCKHDRKLWKTWEPAIRAENLLHRRWLLNNQAKFKQSFLDYVKSYD